MRLLAEYFDHQLWHFIRQRRIRCETCFDCYQCRALAGEPCRDVITNEPKRPIGELPNVCSARFDLDEIIGTIEQGKKDYEGAKEVAKKALGRELIDDDLVEAKAELGRLIANTMMRKALTLGEFLKVEGILK